MTPENSGIHLWPCNNPRCCPSIWQAAQWSNRGDVAGSARDVHRKMRWGGVGTWGKDWDLRRKFVWVGEIRSERDTDECSHTGSFALQIPGIQQYCGGFFSGVKGQLVKKLLTPNHVSFEGELSIFLVLNPGDNLSHKCKYRRRYDAKSRIEAITVPWKRWNILHLDHCRVSRGKCSLSQG